MPAKKKEAKTEEPVYMDEQGHFIHEKEGARYDGGIRRYISAAAAAAAQEAVAAAAAGATGGAAGGKGAKAAASRKETKREDRASSSSGTGGGGGGIAGQLPGAADGCLALYRHGQGTYTSPTLVYTGEWVEDVMEGHGELHFLQTGSRYVGEFKHGRFEGRGAYTWADGSCYDGQWRGSRMHGDGVYTDVHGAVWKGKYFNGTGPGLERVFHNMPARA